MSGILGIGAGGDTGFYDFPLEQSLRFNDGDAGRLQWIPSSAGDSSTDWTISFWIKRCTLGTLQDVLDSGATSDTNSDTIQFRTDDTIRIQTDGFGLLHTNYKFRDTSAWYHIVLKSDLDNATNNQKFRFYINGVDQDDTANGGAGFALDNRGTYPSGNAWVDFNTTDPIQIGARIWNNGNNLDAYLAEFNFVDGIKLDASSFGETKNGIWIPKQYTGSYGTNGFRLTFEDDTTVEGFNTVIYTGTQAVRAISGVGFQPDLVWAKRRSGTAESHIWVDSVRGATKTLKSNSANVEGTNADGITAFNADGFSLGTSLEPNTSGADYVAWCWDAGTGSAASNTDGSITSSVKANTARGFSIVSYTGTGANATVGHGLGVAPDFVIVKNRDTSADWRIYHQGLSGNAKVLTFTTNTEGDNAATFNSTSPTSSVFSVGTSDNTNKLSDELIAYCFADITGYSKFGSYTGTGADGNLVTTGFKPAFVMVKCISSADDWAIHDSTRNTDGTAENRLRPNLSNTESTTQVINFVSNGFELNGNSTSHNENTETYIYAAFADTREYAFWTDQSGNNNDFQHTNLEHMDVVSDNPTNNFATFSSIDSHVASGFSQTFGEGNLQVGAASGSHKQGTRSTIGTKTMNFYYELCSKTAGTTNYQIGVATSSAVVSSTSNAGIYNKAQSSGSSGDIIMVAYSADANAMWTGRNGTWDNSATVAEIEAGTTTNATQTSIDSDEHIHAMYLDQATSYSGTVVANFGQDGTFAGNKISQGNSDDNGNGDFFYAPPSGYFALCTANLPDPGIDPNKGETPDEYFNTVLYTGTNLENAVTGVGFAPDFCWFKNRSDNNVNHLLFDSVRGATETLKADTNAAESTNAQKLKSFDSDGFTLGTDNNPNGSGKSFVAWNWKAGGTAVSNTDGTVNSNVSANTEAGFSIVTFTGGAAGYTVGHGLSQAPEIVFTFNRTDTAGANYVFTTVIDGSIDYLSLDTNAAKNNDPFSMPAFTSSVFSLDNDYGMNTGDNCVAYCFHSVEGYSKIGSYTGNASTNGTFVYTGFRPAFVICKRAGSSTGNWPMFDNKRDVDNEVEHTLFADVGDDELSPYDRMDFVSNGFKLRDTGSGVNNSDTILYMAFAEQPFKYANAR